MSLHQASTCVLLACRAAGSAARAAGNAEAFEVRTGLMRHHRRFLISNQKGWRTKIHHPSGQQHARDLLPALVNNQSADLVSGRLVNQQSKSLARVLEEIHLHSLIEHVGGVDLHLRPVGKSNKLPAHCTAFDGIWHQIENRSGHAASSQQVP